MFFRVKKSGPRQYVQIVQNYWDKARRKTRQQVLLTLGRLEAINKSGGLESLLQSGSRLSKKLMVLSAHKKGQGTRVSSRRIGPLMVFERLWKESGCQEVLLELLSQRHFEYDVERAIFISVVHRLFGSGSDRACSKWQRDYDGDGELSLHHFYRAMAWLGEPLRFEKENVGVPPFTQRCTKDVIEEKLFSRRRDLFSSLEVVFFDTTSIYFEGEGGEILGAYGNSKDHRPDRKQLVVGVILDNEGHPVCCEIWPGNTTDVKTLVPIVKRLRSRFKIHQVCIVSDRGMISQEVLSWLESENWPYILGARMRKQKEVKEKVLSRGGRYRVVGSTKNMNPADKEEESKKHSPLRIKEVKVQDRRYIVCFNIEQAKKDKSDRLEILKGLTEQLKQGAKSLVGNKGYRKYLKSANQGFSIDVEKIKSEARYDGKWVLRTNTDYTAEDVALRYKELWMVEKIFRSLKSLLETRPIYHRSDAAIRGHVFCSFLALVLIKELRERLESKNYQLEWEDVLRDLDRLEEVEIEQDGKRFLLRTEAQGSVGDVFQAVGIAMPPTIRQLN